MIRRKFLSAIGSLPLISLFVKGGKTEEPTPCKHCGHEAYIVPYHVVHPTRTQHFSVNCPRNQDEKHITLGVGAATRKEAIRMWNLVNG